MFTGHQDENLGGSSLYLPSFHIQSAMRLLVYMFFGCSTVPAVLWLMHCYKFIILTVLKANEVWHESPWAKIKVSAELVALLETAVHVHKRLLSHAQPICHPKDCSSQGPFVHGILLVRVLNKLLLSPCRNTEALEVAPSLLIQAIGRIVFLGIVTESPFSMPHCEFLPSF